MKTAKGGTTKVGIIRNCFIILIMMIVAIQKRTWGIGWYKNLLCNNHKENEVNDNNDMNNENTKDFNK